MRKLMTETGLAITAIGTMTVPAYAAAATAKGAVTVKETAAPAGTAAHDSKLNGAADGKLNRSGAIKGEAAGKNTAKIKAPAGKAEFSK